MADEILPPQGEADLPEVITDPSRGDIKTLEISLRERWPMPDEYREAIVKTLTTIILDPQSSRREKTAAARALAAADKINMEARREGLDIHLQERKLAAEQERAETPQEVHVSGTLRYVEDSDWYGNAKRLGASPPTTPDPDSPESSPLQTPRVRPAVGENGNGHSGGTPGSRS